MEHVKAGIAGGLSALAVLGVYMFANVPSAVSGMEANAQASANVASSGAALEVHALQLDFGKQLAASVCNGVGSPVINVSQKIINDADSGEAGNYWGYDTINRTIQVWQTDTEGTYCAAVKYTGNFAGAEGQTSPGNTGVLTGKERGPIQGGYMATVEGSLLANPLWPVHGNVGTTDYQCDLSGNCPGAINWVTQYFSNDYAFTYEWWGWIYRAGGNKTWVNSSTGNEGDII